MNKMLISFIVVLGLSSSAVFAIENQQEQIKGFNTRESTIKECENNFADMFKDYNEKVGKNNINPNVRNPSKEFRPEVYLATEDTDGSHLVIRDSKMRADIALKFLNFRNMNQKLYDLGFKMVTFIQNLEPPRGWPEGRPFGTTWWWLVCNTRDGSQVIISESEEHVRIQKRYNQFKSNLKLLNSQETRENIVDIFKLSLASQSLITLNGPNKTILNIENYGLTGSNAYRFLLQSCEMLYDTGFKRVEFIKQIVNSYQFIGWSWDVRYDCGINPNEFSRK